MPMEFRNLSDCSFDTLYKGFGRAFADYQIHFEKEEIRSMLRRRGYDADLSFAFFDEGEIVAFTLNGTGTFDGIPTAYDTGTGTAKEYRGKGLAGEIFTRATPYLKDAGIRQYLLEVLHDNHKAIAVYRNLGFETTRHFDCFRQTIDKVNHTVHNPTCIIRPIDLKAVADLQSACDFAPSWQNSIDSINRGQADLTMLGAFIGDIAAGHCVFDSATGDLTQIAVLPEFRRRGIASQLLHEAIRNMRTDFVKVLNVSSADETLHAFLESRRIAPASRQLEMKLALHG